MKAIDGDYILAESEWDELAWVRQQTDVPRGCKVEIIEGIVTVTPLSANAHHGVAERVQRQLHEVIPEDWGIHHRPALALPPRLSVYAPDLAVVPEAALGTGDDDLLPAAMAELVVEITSKATASNDRIHKHAGYAEAGIPSTSLSTAWPQGDPRSRCTANRRVTSTVCCAQAGSAIPSYCRSPSASPSRPANSRPAEEVTPTTPPPPQAPAPTTPSTAESSPGPTAHPPHSSTHT